MSTTHSTPARDATAAALHGHLSEMFCSIQGEGLFVGERQIFVRTAGCVATCSWCDTVYSKVRTPRFVIHNAPKNAPRPWRENPVALGDVLGDVADMARAHEPVRTVSITGGEPLEQPEFVRELARSLRASGFRIHLETAGLHPDALASLIGHIDVIAMDVKLESATGVDHRVAHRAFLRVMSEAGFDAHRATGRSAFVKVIVDLKASAEEIENAARLVAESSRALPFVIQPESDALLGRHATRESRAALLELVDAGARAASRHLDDVRVIPQTHKVLHVR
ncbi:MAG TPA: 7-carboxy-7-deazaguanine synthase QueE [Candidatus Krumholzibacteria bacterium]